MAVKKIPVSLLKPGMYVTKLDISWIDSPFMYHHLKIKNQSQIDKLVKAGVKNISIDTVKGDDVKETSEPNTTPNATDNTISKTLVKEIEDEVEEKPPLQKTSFNDELKVAKVLHGQVTQLAEEINESLKNDEAVDPSLVSPLIEGTIASLERNNQALSALINMQRKDQTLANHAFGTFSLVLSMAKMMHLNENERDSLALAAFFHDAGWLKLPLNLIGKKSSYSASEKKLIQQHVKIGLTTLKTKCELSPLVIRFISEHHERIDGSGYPSGLKAEKIHPLSKMFQVCVRYDELVHGMNDQPAVTPHGALSLLFKDAKKEKLDEVSVSTLVSLMSVYPVGSAVLLSNKEKATVVETNSSTPKLPKVEVFYDSTGMAHSKPKLLDLAKQKGNTPVTIQGVLDLNDSLSDPANLLGIKEDD